MIRLVAGLGNPGAKYEYTRHNMGFLVIDAISEELGISFSHSDKFSGDIGEKIINGEKVWFLKPDTFMNLSGVSVGSLASFYKILPEEIFIIHDEMNIPFGVLRLRHGGSAGGHNGLSSLISHLGSDKFPRLKMGIGRKSGGDAVSHVLGKFTPEEKEVFDNFINSGRDAVLKALSEGINAAMNEFNRKEKKSE